MQFQDLLIEIGKEIFIAVLMLLGISIPLSAPGSSESSTQATQSTSTSIASTTLYAVLKVVDGDTIHIDIDGKKETVRLIGINTPETVDPRRPVECFGKEASNKAKELLTERKVRIETEASQGERDKYGRLLGYIYRDDGLLFNKFMIEEGYADEYTYRLPYKYQTEFKAAQKSAENGKKGLWAPGACGA